MVTTQRGKHASRGTCLGGLRQDFPWGQGRGRWGQEWHRWRGSHTGSWKTSPRSSKHLKGVERRWPRKGNPGLECTQARRKGSEVLRDSGSNFLWVELPAQAEMSLDRWGDSKMAKGLTLQEDLKNLGFPSPTQLFWHQRHKDPEICPLKQASWVIRIHTAGWGKHGF